MKLAYEIMNRRSFFQMKRNQRRKRLFGRNKGQIGQFSPFFCC